MFNPAVVTRTLRWTAFYHLISSFPKSQNRFEPGVCSALDVVLPNH
jgi:hypothetical protein